MTKMTKKQRINLLTKRLSTEHLFNNTSIFRNATGLEEPYNEQTVKAIKLKLEIWLESWILPELDELLK